MAVKKLEVLILGNAKGAVHALEETKLAAGGTGSKFAGMGKKVAAGFAIAGAAAVGFAVKSAHTFQSVGTDVLKLQRVTGLGAENASKLRFELQQVGITADVGAKNLSMFGKKLAGSKDTMKDFGLATKDSSGHLLPMSELLGRAADRLGAMKNNTERNALAMKLFGKQGLVMLKLLDKGRDGMSKLADQAKKYGLVLTKNNLGAVKESIKAHRDQEAAMQGLQVQIGMHVLPVLTKFTTFIATNLPKATMFIQKHAGMFKVLAGVVGGIMIVALGAYIVSTLQAAAATLAATWPILAVIAGLALLAAGVIYAYTHWKWFHNAVDATVRFLRTKAWPAIQAFAMFVADAFSKLVGFVRAHWSQISAVVKFYIEYVKTVVGVALDLIHGKWGDAWTKIKAFAGIMLQAIVNVVADHLGQVVDWFKRLPGRIFDALGDLNDVLYDKGVQLVKGLIRGIKSEAGSIGKAITSVIPGGGLVAGALGHIPGLAGGGRAVKGRVNLVGEHGPELVRWGSDGTVIPAGRTHAIMMGGARRSGGGGGGVVDDGGGGNTYVTINVAGSVITERDLATMIRKLQVRDRRIRLGVATTAASAAF